MRQRSLPLWLKRSVDVSVAAVGLVILAPLMAALAVIVRIALGSPVLFRQVRIGYRSRPFTLVKFRTMAEERAADGRLLPDEDRLRPVGRTMRSFTLDELPQLWNVLRGELSLVGPRPLLPEYLPLYTPEQSRRHDVLPGITGWAQVNGRNALPWVDRFRLDVWYVDHWSILLDMKILALTFAQVVRRSGINAEGHATMPNFRGGALS